MQDRYERNAREATLALAAREHNAKLIVPKRRVSEQLYLLKFSFASYQGEIEECEALLRNIDNHLTDGTRKMLHLLKPVMVALGAIGNEFDFVHDEQKRLWEILAHINHCVQEELSVSTAALKVSGNQDRECPADMVYHLAKSDGAMAVLS